MTNASGSTLYGFEQPPLAKPGRLRRWLANPALAAALGSFLAFAATQAAEYIKTSIQDNNEMVREELAEARALMNTIPTPSTSAEADSIVKKLERQVKIYTTEEAQGYIEGFIPGEKAEQERLRQREEAEAELKRKADEAAAIAAQTAANDAAKAAADAEAARAAAAAEEAERQRRADDIARAIEGREQRLNRWLQF